jgi:surface antigen
MNIKTFTIIIAAAITTVGCQTNDGVTGGTKQTVGTLLGGVGGGVLGSTIGGGRGKTAATIGGTLLGAYLGGEIGRSMDKTDQLMAERTTTQTLEYAPDNRVSTWSNPNTGVSGRAEVTSTFTNNNGWPCRNLVHNIQTSSGPLKISGAYCRNPTTGVWEQS